MADISLDTWATIGIEDDRSASGFRLTITETWYTNDFGYLVPRPKELPPRMNLLIALDFWVWLWLGLTLLSIAVVETSLYLTNGFEEKINWVP